MNVCSGFFPLLLGHMLQVLAQEKEEYRTVEIGDRRTRGVLDDKGKGVKPQDYIQE